MQTLNTALIAVSDINPRRLTIISRAAYNHTAAMGVWERLETRRQWWEKGSRSSRAKAKMVREPAWMPVMATRFITAKPQRVNSIAGVRPMALKKSWATCWVKKG